MFEPIRGGTRGGQAEFKWSDVSADKDRENYLGHSINAPTGRWQKNKDIHWYNRDVNQTQAEKDEEIRKIKELEADALAVALGYEPASKSSTKAATTESAEKSQNDPDRIDEKEDKRRKKKEHKEEKRLRKEIRRLEKAERESRHGIEDARSMPHRHYVPRSRSRSPRPRSREQRDHDMRTRPRSRSWGRGYNPRDGHSRNDSKTKDYDMYNSRHSELRRDSR